MTDDLYSRIDYRRLIAWPERIGREWPFLQKMLATAPSGRILDLGCGTGEHSRFLASQGFDVVGIDASESMLAKAIEPALPDNLEFIAGDIVDLADLVGGHFGAAICLGNTLPHVREWNDLTRFFRGLHARLLPGAPLLLQILNYERIFEQTQRFLPLNFRQEDDGEIVFLRLMDPRPDGSVIFTPSALRYRPDGDPPLEVLSSRNVMLRGWKRTEIEAALDEAAFRERTIYGTVGEVTYVSTASTDLVIVARHDAT